MKIALVAGEASGDLLGAELMAALRHIRPDVEFIGMGGPRMQAQGLDSWYDYKSLSIMGLVEVLKHLPKLLKLRKSLLARLIAAKPDVVIGIDAPDFNLGLEKRCKQAGLRTVHFVSPSIWAWRQRRAAKMAQSADLVLCLFPMEPPIYAQYGVNAAFIGHPLADSIPLSSDRQAAKQLLGLDGMDMLAILPGSRLSEIDKLLPTFIGAAQILHREFPQLQFLIPAANDSCRSAIVRHLQDRPLPNTHVLDGDTQTVMIASKAVLLASGTATLEAMLCKRPMVVCYRISPITYFIVVRLLGLIKVTSYSLPNVLSAERLVPELMQEACNPETAAQSLRPYITDDRLADVLSARFLDIHLQLRKNAAQRAAESVLDLLESKRP
ncbi:MAG: lipid-A-disaccharide synthase [Arenimonas sp.]|nr:lipid-A-disaccharide synthase [Arenimonas sp.]